MCINYVIIGHVCIYNTTELTLDFSVSQSTGYNQALIGLECFIDISY